MVDAPEAGAKFKRYLHPGPETLQPLVDKPFRVIGAMSGSSLDGLDLSLCRFPDGDRPFNIEAARTVPYPADLRRRLLEAMDAPALEAARLDRDLGRFIGEACRDLIAEAGTADLVASHGHTLYHRPEEGLTTALGHGAWIAAACGLPVVNELRSLDVALGGQGAPLVPLGERDLFPGHRAFLNLGGICNVGLHGTDRVLGYDACIGNQALDRLAGEAGLDCDRDGALARSGAVNEELLATLDALPFHAQSPPRSLGREWFREAVEPLIGRTDIPLADRLRTVVEHIAGQVAKALEGARGPVLVTGGGAHNGFLVERLRARSSTPVELPEKDVIDFKEALVFAWLGLLRWQGRPTSLASVTGAARDSVGGAVWLPY